jgi:hypothetical protein
VRLDRREQVVVDLAQLMELVVAQVRGLDQVFFFWSGLIYCVNFLAIVLLYVVIVVVLLAVFVFHQAVADLFQDLGEFVLESRETLLEFLFFDHVLGLEVWIISNLDDIFALLLFAVLERSLFFDHSRLLFLLEFVPRVNKRDENLVQGLDDARTDVILVDDVLVDLAQGYS